MNCDKREKDYNGTGVSIIYRMSLVYISVLGFYFVKTNLNHFKCNVRRWNYAWNRNVSDRHSVDLTLAAASVCICIFYVCVAVCLCVCVRAKHAVQNHKCKKRYTKNSWVWMNNVLSPFELLYLVCDYVCCMWCHSETTATAKAPCDRVPERCKAIKYLPSFNHRMSQQTKIHNHNSIAIHRYIFMLINWLNIDA